MNGKTIAIITARGGSKRIPKKNIKEFMGLPMIAYAIRAAYASNIFDTVMISTDDAEIAATAKEYGAEVPFMRSARTSSDFATTYDVLDEVISTYKKHGKEYDCVCCIYPCVPFLASESLVEAHKMFASNIDAIQPVCRFPVPIEWALEIKEGLLVESNPEAGLIRSQDLVPKYYDVGMFYFIRTDALVKYKSLHPPKTAPYIIDETQCQDIDTMEDWRLAELKYKILHQKEE